MINELLPLPVRSQIPTFSPGLIDMVILSRIAGPAIVYEAERFLSSIAPFEGQISGTCWSSPARFSSGVVLVKFFNLETAPIEVSREVPLSDDPS